MLHTHTRDPQIVLDRAARSFVVLEMQKPSAEKQKQQQPERVNGTAKK